MKYLLAFLTLAYAGSSIALKCHRCGWIKDNEVLKLIPNSNEQCASDPDPTMLAQVEALQYPREFARKHIKEQELNMSKMAERVKRQLTTLDINPAGNSSDSAEEYTDMTPPEGQSTKPLPASSSSSPSPVSGRGPIDFNDDEDDKFPAYDSLEQMTPTVSKSNKSSSSSSSKSANAIRFDDKPKGYVRIHPVCATLTGTFRGKSFVIRDFHFTEEENVLDGKCFNDIPPQYRMIMEDLFRRDVIEEIDLEISAMRSLQIAYCGSDGCNNGDYRKANACPASPRPTRADFLKVPRL